MKRFIITESERMSIRKMYGLIREAGPYDPETEGQSPRPMDIPNTGNTIDLSQYEGINKSFFDEDKKYFSVQVKKNILIGKNKTNRKWEPIPDDRNLGDKSLYTYYLNHIIKAKTEAENQDPNSFGEKVNGIGRYGEPRIFYLGNMTKEILQQVYNFAKEYQNAHDNFLKTNKGRFCVGDVFDIIKNSADVEKVKECGAPSYTDQVPKYLPNATDRDVLADTIYFMMKYPNDTRTIELKKVLGIQ
jgi:hypothetical protein